MGILDVVDTMECRLQIINVIPCKPQKAV